MRVATELARQATQLQEMELAMQRLDQLMNQADQRAKDTEDKASAAVTAISRVKIPNQKIVELNNRDAEKFWPETYTADRLGKESFARVLGRGRDVPECFGARLIGETTAWMGCRFPSSADRDE